MEHPKLLLGPLNELWRNCMANFNPTNIRIIQYITYIMSCNAVIAFNLKQEYNEQFRSIFPKMMMAYSQISPNENKALMNKSISYQANKIILNAKSAIINIIKNYILQTKNSEYIPQIMKTINTDYEKSSQYARTPVVLSFVTVMLREMQDSIIGYLDDILS